VAWGARSASALSPLVAAGSHGLYGTRGGAASHLTVSCNTSPGCRPGVVPAPGTNRGRAGALILPKA